MLSKSKLKTWLRKNKFKKTHGDNRNIIKYGVVKKNNRFFRFRTNEHEFSGGEKRWTVDVSCMTDDFDRCANRTEEHAIPLKDFMKRY